MREMKLLDKAKTPGGGKEIQLYQHDHDFFIKAGNVVLMSSRTRASEEALAELACKEIGRDQRPQVLIGGLGMGFTLRAALDNLPKGANLIVAELVPEVVRWNRGVLGVLARKPLADKRVAIRSTDVSVLIKQSRGHYHAILMDVDNGSGGICHRSNDWFYRFEGLRKMWDALRPKGVLAIWSAGPDVEFVSRMRKVGFLVKEIPVRAHADGKGAHYLIWIAKKSSSGKAGGYQSPRRTHGSRRK